MAVCPIYKIKRNDEKLFILLRTSCRFLVFCNTMLDFFESVVWPL